MARVTCDVTISLDGFVAGPEQSLEQPLGRGGEQLHRWQFEAREDDAAERAGILEAGAYIMGRNMFGPERGAPSGSWRGWWGEDPPYHAPVFVLTHYASEPLVMEGGTVFRFVTGGVHRALQLAREAAGGRNVAIAGGASTINQFLEAGLLDELRLHISPKLLGSGERLFEGVSGLEFIPRSSRSTGLVTHVVYEVVPPEKA